MSTEPRPLRDLFEAPLDEAGVQRVWSRVREGRTISSSRSPWWWAIPTLGVAAAALLAFMVTRSASSGRIESTDGSELATSLRVTEGATRVVPLDDGSRLELASSAALDVLANDGERFVTALREGRCHFVVEPGGPRRWQIETDLATVEVVGTEFTVERGASGVEVTVDHGIVLVRGEHVPGRVQRLTAGQRLAVPSPTQVSAAPRPHASDVPVVASPSEPVRGLEVPAEVPGEVLVPRVTARGSRTSVPAVDALLVQADQAIAERRFAEAATLLERVVREHTRDPRSSMAAYQLGRVALDELRQPGRAAEAFAHVLRRGRPRALQDDAHIRHIEALARNGERMRAVEAIARWQSEGASEGDLEEARRRLQ